MEEKKGIVVKVDHVTKDYGKGRGNFDMSFNVHKGEAFGWSAKMVQERPQSFVKLWDLSNRLVEIS